MKDRIVKLFGGHTSAEVGRLAHAALDAEARHREHAKRDATTIAGLVARVAELEAHLATAGARLISERTVGANALIALARAAGKVEILGGDARHLERLERIGKADGLAALEAELAEYPAAAPMSEVVS